MAARDASLLRLYAATSIPRRAEFLTILTPAADSSHFACQAVRLSGFPIAFSFDWC
jgi:hypothetical protein